MNMWFVLVGARVHCQESGEESSETESVYSLKCHISQEVNHLHEGLKHVSSIIQLWRSFVLSLSLSLLGCKGRTNIWLSITCFLYFLESINVVIVCAFWLTFPNNNGLCTNWHFSPHKFEVMGGSGDGL